jgi:hypothetical protein
MPLEELSCGLSVEAHSEFCVSSRRQVGEEEASLAAPPSAGDDQLTLLDPLLFWGLSDEPRRARRGFQSLAGRSATTSPPLG